MSRAGWLPSCCHGGPGFRSAPLARENVEELVCWANKSAVIRLGQSNSLCRNLCVSVPGAISVLEALETSETMPTALEERLVTSIVCFLGINISISIPLQMYVALRLQGEAAGQD